MTIIPQRECLIALKISLLQEMTNSIILQLKLYPSNLPPDMHVFIIYQIQTIFSEEYL
jgi:hypothetical protein